MMKKRDLKAVLEEVRNLRRQFTSRRPRRCWGRSREILFRGKRLDNGEWVYGDLVTKYPYHKGLTIVENGVYHEVDPETVGQYTGTDIFRKGFKRVFVGDLFQDESGTVLEVVFESGSFGFGAWRKEGEWLSMRSLKRRCELVGNKWDDSDLLSGGDAHDW